MAFKKGVKRENGGRKPRARQEFTELQKKVLAQVEEIVPSKLQGFKEAFAGISMKYAIKATCEQCYGLEDMNEVANCRSEGCPLWRFRPYQKKDKT